MKIQGGLIGITRRKNSRNKFFLISHVVSEVKKELREISQSQKKETKIHHALNQDNVKRDILSHYVKGKQIYKYFIDEKLWRGSTISICRVICRFRT